MTTIKINGWNEGFEKISFTKLQIEILGLSLKESKINVDAILEGAQITIEVENMDIARSFIEKSVKIGVMCEIVDF